MITLKSELAARLLERDPARAAGELEEIQAVSREALAEVREAVKGYRGLALAESLTRARTALAAAGIDCELAGAQPALPADVDAVLAWAVREGTTNVIRHSQARHCAIRIRADDESAALEIDDDGRAAAGAGHGGSGLDGPARARAARARHARGRRAARGRLPAARHRPAGRAMIRVLIAEDQAMVRGALASLLALEDDIEVVGEVSRGDEVLAAARATAPDVALLDIEMPGRDGIAVAGELARELPALRTLILTTFGRPGYLRRALENGARGFLLKDAPARELAAAIRDRASPAAARSTRRSRPRRSPRARAR